MPLTSTVETISRLSQYDGQREDDMADVALGIRSNSAMSKPAARFPRTARLLRHADFERVYKQGRRHFSASMTVFYWSRPEADTQMRTTAISGKSGAQGMRVGFTVGRALGGAVQRNRMKRRLREAVRMTFPVGVAADVVINPKKSLLTADFAAIVAEVSRAFAIIEQKLGGKSAAEPEVNRAGSGKPGSGSRS